MKIADIIRLRTLGYTKEEVQAFLDMENQPEPQPEPQPEQPEPQPEQQPATGNDDILAAINNLTAAIQASNLKQAEQPTAATETTDAILTNLIK